MIDGSTNGHETALQLYDQYGAKLPSMLELRAASDVLLDRARFMRQVGLAFGDKRDYYAVLGYDRSITTQQYRETYQRGGIAKRICEAYPRSTWRRRDGAMPELYEDEDPDKETKFESAWTELSKRLRIWARLEQADILAGLSTYSIILLGAPGALDTELPRATNANQLLYLKPYLGGGGPSSLLTAPTLSPSVDATIESYDTRSESPRFGEVEYYAIRNPLATTGRNPSAAGENIRVHWTRVIHVAEGCLDNDVFGVPVLENIWNLLHDLMKVTGGGAEAFWLRANQGFHANIDKDMDLTSADKTLDKLRDDLDKYQHGLSRWIRTRGVDINTLGSDVANFGGPADAILKQISGSKGIPLRILTGSEMGELASSQDAENWNAQVQDRRTSYAGPCIVNRLVDRLIEYNYLPQPVQYATAWPVEEELTETQKADLAVKLAQANSTMGEPLFTEAEIREKSYKMAPLSDEQRQEIADRKTESVKRAQEAMGTPAPSGNENDQTGNVVPFAQRAAEDVAVLNVLQAAIEAKNVEVIDAIIGTDRRDS